VDMLSRLGPCIDALSDSREGVVDKVAELLEKGLKLAAHYDRREHVQGLVGRFHKLLHSLRDSLHLVQTLDTLAEKSFHSLRKFGMRDEIDALLKQIHDLLTGGKDISALDMKQDKDGTAKLRALLHVASQWYFFGKDRQAETVVNKAREVLFKGDQSPLEQTRIACVYAATVGQAPVEVAQWRLEELFQKLRGVKDTFTTSTHYSLTQLKVIESVVLAVVNDDFTMGANARRWLDEDEFLIRRRLHREFQDMKKNASH